jgi:hypothetical protein
MHGNDRWQVSRAAFYGAVLFLREGKPRAGEGVALIPEEAAPERSAGPPFSPLLCSGKGEKACFDWKSACQLAPDSLGKNHEC